MENMKPVILGIIIIVMMMDVDAAQAGIFNSLFGGKPQPAQTCPAQQPQPSPEQQEEQRAAVKAAMQTQMQQADPQTMTVPVSNGFVTVEPQRITRLYDGSLGLSNANVHTTLITQVLPTPAPIIPKQDIRTAFEIQGVDDIEIKGILPETLDANGLDAVKNFVQSGTLVAQQRFAVEQYKINSDAQLEWLRITKSFVLWGFLFSIPFIVTVYYVTRNIAAGWRNWQKEVLEFKQKELESAERITMSDYEKYHK